jgi:hypothetical protein
MIEPEKHLVAFVNAFVRKDRRSRWHFLFEQNSDKAYRNSHKLLNDLAREFVIRDDALQNVSNPYQQGVFYPIGREEPRVETLDQILKGDPFCDAIFSIDPGRLAIFFFHEFETYVLKRAR